MLRDSFKLPHNKLYMCGHSLGPAVNRTAVDINQAIHDFEEHLVAGWNEKQWFELPYAVGGKIAHLIGAKKDEVAVCDSTVVNLYKVLSAALKMNSHRKVILTTKDNFPADLYVANGLAEVQVVTEENIIENIKNDVAVVMLTHVNYRTANKLNMARINVAAHEQGALTVWDLCHSAGAVPLDLNTDGCDFAVGCTYKYLSGGPGSPAFVYVNRKHHQICESPIKGWVGHDSPFEFSSEYTASGVKKFMGGTPQILSLVGIQAGLSVVTREAVVTAQDSLVKYAQIMCEAFESLGFRCHNPKKRGAHIGLEHPEGYTISRAMIDAGVICDYRAPNLIRLCINPLYIGHAHVSECLDKVEKLIRNKIYLSNKYIRKVKVT